MLFLGPGLGLGTGPDLFLTQTATSSSSRRFYRDCDHLRDAGP